MKVLIEMAALVAVLSLAESVKTLSGKVVADDATIADLNTHLGTVSDQLATAETHQGDDLPTDIQSRLDALSAAPPVVAATTGDGSGTPAASTDNTDASGVHVATGTATTTASVDAASSPAAADTGAQINQATAQGYPTPANSEAAKAPASDQ